MVPFQFDMRRSSPSERPYEHASTSNCQVTAWSEVDCAIVPAPSPFSPFSSSSSRRKFLGTFAPIIANSSDSLMSRQRLGLIARVTTGIRGIEI